MRSSRCSSPWQVLLGLFVSLAAPALGEAQEAAYPEDWYGGGLIREAEAQLIYRALQFFQHQGLDFLLATGAISPDSLPAVRARADTASAVVGANGEALWSRNADGGYDRPQPPLRITAGVALSIEEALTIYYFSTGVSEMEELVINSMLSKIGDDGQLIVTVR